MNKLPTSMHPVSPRNCEQTILLGIGNETIRQEVASVLERLGRPVVPFGDGYHLIERIADAIIEDLPERRPCLIVIDSVLSGCTGLSLVAGLRQLGWDTPVILLIPPEDEHLRRQAWVNGATGVFMAPFDSRELCVFSELILDGLGSLPNPQRGTKRHLPMNRREREERVNANG